MSEGLIKTGNATPLLSTDFLLFCSHRTVAPNYAPPLSSRVDNAKKKVDEKAMALLAEKKKRCASAVNLADERKAVEKTVDEFHDCIDELHAELSDAKLAEKEAKNRMKTEQRRMSKRQLLQSD